ncbi:DUF6518 family protein [Paractinoplanes atraurantiacus]|uniref:DUF6518 family protein n=1 Tax=Paractinoplanes atraurantiacus TaxID=1036182 RepID=UPI000BE4447D|nr:DUF6518 family protein [Actinoplanes atraurantiacus]
MLKIKVLAAALVFGMAAALIKGDGGGVRDTVGNLSTPWLLVAFVPGMFARSVPRGAVIGLVSTLVALLGFYVVVTLTLDDQMPDMREHLLHVLRLNRRWIWSGLLSGPVMGALGAWLGRRALLPVTGVLLVLEPIVIVSARVVPGWRSVIHWTLEPVPYLVELVAGVLVLSSMRRRRRATPRGLP